MHKLLLIKEIINKLKKALAVVRRSQKILPRRKPHSRRRRTAKKLEMVTTLTYKPNLVKINAHNFELLW